MPQLSKSLALRVARVAPCERVIAAIAATLPFGQQPDSVKDLTLGYGGGKH
jgi:hypothetical protein